MFNLAILGYGAEGKSVENYFKTHNYEDTPPENIKIKVFDDFKPEEIKNLKLENYDVIFRSPSVSPHFIPKVVKVTSATQYFFDHCPARIIGVTGTKGKGTTSSMITALLTALKIKTHLLGNIGVPALDQLDKIKKSDAVIFEMSSFQLWDLEKSPQVSVVLRIEPDHLNVHKNFDDYVSAKANIAKNQNPEDATVHYLDNTYSVNIAKASKGKKLAYPAEISKPLLSILDSLTIPGAHNRENAEAALLAVYAYMNSDQTFKDFLKENQETFKSALKDFRGLPHRCQFLRELNNVKYYDDNYSSALPALDVALKAFEDYPTVLIAGGFSKGTDAEIKQRIFSAPNLEKAILIGSTAEILAKGESPEKYELANNLEDAVKKARAAAESVAAKKPAIVLMSPGFASFDMFKNFTDRGEQFTKLVKGLK